MSRYSIISKMTQVDHYAEAFNDRPDDPHANARCIQQYREHRQSAMPLIERAEQAPRAQLAPLVQIF
jgi:hypothetical protein